MSSEERKGVSPIEWASAGAKAVSERAFTIVVERDEDGYYVASVIELPGCHTQARSLDELFKRMEEAITAYLDEAGAEYSGSEFVGVRRLKIAVKG